MENFISSSVSTAALKRFFEKIKQKDYEIHALEIFKDGEIKLRLIVRFLSNPHSEYYTVTLTEETVNIHIALAFINGYEPTKDLNGTRIK